jgi:hypothetical protein
MKEWKKKCYRNLSETSKWYCCTYTLESHPIKRRLVAKNCRFFEAACFESWPSELQLVRKLALPRIAQIKQLRTPCKMPLPLNSFPTVVYSKSIIRWSHRKNRYLSTSHAIGANYARPFSLFMKILDPLKLVKKVWCSGVQIKQFSNWVNQIAAVKWCPRCSKCHFELNWNAIFSVNCYPGWHLR